ncbi:hypothetical protein BMS3Bbin15_00143 [archaeon BMS3Bbin15]|nr:hypothetical protein BMS3Bbin15_00143 [archaeon BMS3Bbin15]
MQKINFKLGDASLDLRYLLDRGYSREQSVSIVGNRYNLNSKERNLLYRCIFSKRDVLVHINRLVSKKELEDKKLCIDGYNVLIIVESYLKGKEIILCDDGFLRDISGVYGKYRFGKISEKAVEKILKALKELRVREVEVFFDSRVSFSGQLSSYFMERAEGYNIPLKAVAVKQGDAMVLRCSGIPCSGDRSIIEKAEQIFDLAHYIIPEDDIVNYPSLNPRVLRQGLADASSELIRRY